MVARRAWAGPVVLLLACDGGTATLPDSGQATGPYAGDWQGVTSQSEPIVFRVAGNAVTYLRFEYAMSGAGCSVTGRQMRSLTAPISNGAFTVSESYAGSSTTLAGTFTSASEATGTFTGSDTYSSCTATADATWQATKLPPAPSYDGSWSGQTSESKSIAMVVSNNRITSLTLEYAATDACVKITTFSGAPAGASPIVAGAADFSHGRDPLMVSGVVTFTDGGTATGSLDISYYDASTQPACSASAQPTFSLQRQ